MSRNRKRYFLFILFVMLLGLASRKYSLYIPMSINSFLGDSLWALMIFLIFGLIFNKQSTIKVAIWALTFSFTIEVSQLYHAPWIDLIRETRLGGLVLGFGFLWRDLISYTAGITVGFLLEEYTK